MEVVITVFVQFDNYQECVEERTVDIQNLYTHFHVLIKKYGTTCKIVCRPIS
jgi:hypothetical protein